MKTLLTMTLFFLGSMFQIRLTTNELIGVWKVSEVQMEGLAPEFKNNKQLAAQMKAMMLRTVFEIRADHRFKMNMPLPGSAEGDPEGVWKYDQAKGILQASEVGNKSRLAEIMIKKDKAGNVFFTMSDAPVVFKVHK